VGLPVLIAVGVGTGVVDDGAHPGALALQPRPERGAELPIG
jgi:hypothetical protein